MILESIVPEADPILAWDSTQVNQDTHKEKTEDERDLGDRINRQMLSCKR